MLAAQNSIVNRLPGGCPLFPADNIWNTAVGALPVDGRSNAYIQSSTIGDAGSQVGAVTIASTDTSQIVADVGALAVAAAGGGAAGVGVAVGVAIAHNNISGEQPNVYDTSLAPNAIDSVRTFATGDEVLVSAGYDSAKGVAGHRVVP